MGNKMLDKDPHFQQKIQSVMLHISIKGEMMYGKCIRNPNF